MTLELLAEVEIWKERALKAENALKCIILDVNKESQDSLPNYLRYETYQNVLGIIDKYTGDMELWKTKEK